ncbi:MAG: recombinase family protein [Solirubrobacteraceae bacterium]|jgi:hypothetical protein
MKALVVPRTQQQRKEALRKEITQMHFERHNIDKHDQEKPRIWRAVIYMCEPNKKDGVSEPSVPMQLAFCRREAKRLRAEVVGEFVDIREFRFVRPGLYQALQLAREQQLDYLIVASLDVLADFDDDRFEVAWHLGQAGTIPMEAMTEDD